LYRRRKMPPVVAAFTPTNSIVENNGFIATRGLVAGRTIIWIDS
jgi:hypothetical protein